MNFQYHIGYLWIVERIVSIILFLFILTSTSLSAADGDDPESEYKAYFIYTFSNYFQWEDLGTDSTFI